jgi:hypothetical protein
VTLKVFLHLECYRVPRIDSQGARDRSLGFLEVLLLQIRLSQTRVGIRQVRSLLDARAEVPFGTMHVAT